MWFIGFLVIGYAFVCLYVCKNIDRLAFNKRKLPEDHAFDFPFEFEEIDLQSDQYERINCLFFKTRKSSKGLVLFLHGNSRTLERWAYASKPFTELGYDIIIPDYPGFGKSIGVPNEAGIKAAADLIYQWAIDQNYSADSIIVVGRSMGSIAASWLASKDAFKTLILETPFSNMGKIVKVNFPFLHVCKGMYNMYTADQYLQTASMPVYMIRAEKDQVTKHKSNEDLLPFTTKMYEIKGASHGNIASFDEYKEALEEILLN